MLNNARTILAYIFSIIPCKKIFRFLAKSSVNAENYDMKWNGEYRAMKQILDDLPEDCVIYDIGANHGQWSKEVLALKPNCILHAFEMIPSFAEATKKIIGENRVHEIGLSDSNSEIEVYKYGGGAAVKQIEFNAKTEERVKVILKKGDDLGLEAPHFIKMDVEGHELKVLQGLKNTIEKYKPIIQFEYGTCSIAEHSLLKDRFDFLESYDCYQIFPTKLVKRQYMPALENFWTVNYIAMPKK